MEQQKSNSHSKNGKHLKRVERIQMEGLLKAKVSTAEIARQLERTQRPLHRLPGSKRSFVEAGTVKLCIGIDDLDRIARRGVEPSGFPLAA